MAVKKHQIIPNNWEEREKLRDKGQFWTPNWVAEAMVSYLINDRKIDVIYDPATGNGAFFEAIIKLNLSKIKFYGTDIDDEILKSSIYKNNNCYVEIRDFIKNPPKRKFKGIIANPPYIRHHRLDRETKDFVKKLAISITGDKIDGRAGYHIYFLIQALNLLEKNGKLSFILPADTFEGVFSEKLWKWIANIFHIEAVVTFDEKATPFPGVDTNAIVVFIKNAPPKKNLFWVKVNKAYNDDLLKFVSSNFQLLNFDNIEIIEREIVEAIKLGLSRPPQKQNNYKYHLFDFAKVMRGIATGANEFFFLTSEQIDKFKIPKKFFKRAVGRTKDITNSILSEDQLELLDKNNRPTYLLSINKEKEIPKSLQNYIQKGVDLKLHERSLIKQRTPWYKMEQRKIPPILFTYLGRKNSRFILNRARVLPLTGFLCVYPIYSDEEYIINLWKALNEPETIENLKIVGKSYGSGSIKVEPSNLNRLPIPEHIVLKYNLNRKYVSEHGQLEIFRESNNTYGIQRH